MTINTTKKSLLITSLLPMALIVSPACQKAPAEFEIASLEIAPQEVAPGEEVTITVEVQNCGGRKGSHTVTLAIAGLGDQAELVKLRPGRTETVTFRVIDDRPGAWRARVGRLAGTYRVLRPAEFTISKLDITPSVAGVGETVMVTADITNMGEVEGSYSVRLTIDGSQVETKELMVAPGHTQRVSFTFAPDAAARYSVEVGGLSGLLVVSETGDALTALAATYPELYEELLKLPDLRDIDKRDEEAIEDIAVLAFDPRYRSAFESMLDEGVREKRKYCTPLEALLWIAYDKEFAGYNPLVGYTLKKLLREAWENTSTSKDYSLDRWQDFDEVVDRLSSPMSVSRYMQENISYVYEPRGGWQGPSETFERRAGQCGDQAMFATYCLEEGGYEACILVAGEFSKRRTNTHAVCVCPCGAGPFHTIDNGVARGPFSTIEDATRDICRRSWWSYEGYELYDRWQRMILRVAPWECGEGETKSEGD